MNKKSYRHLTQDDRVQIWRLLSRGFKQIQIAEVLGVHRSMISRETRRNSGKKGYRSKQANCLAGGRRRSASKVPRKMTRELWDEVNDCLRVGWSPEQISGRLKSDEKVDVSTTWIYEHVWQDRRSGGDLYKHLRRSGKKRNNQRRSGSGRGCIPNRQDIKDRPAVVEEKSRNGDWEGDTVIGSGHSGALVTLVDRHSKYLLMARVDDRRSKSVTDAILGLMSPDVVAHTITFDNGKEFSEHERISGETGALAFFATPYHSWERGLNEHTNGLVREYFPKRTDFRLVSDEDVQRVQDLLNDRPRKELGYRTPREVFFGVGE